MGRDEGEWSKEEQRQKLKEEEGDKLMKEWIKKV